MKYSKFIVCFLALAFVVSAQAETSRVQKIHLHRGWNSVFVEVDPINSKPADLFQGTPISIAAAFTGADKTLEFVQNPSTNTLTPQNGWDVWYASDRADGFLSSLFLIAGNKPYLLYSESDFDLNINGNVLLNTVKWRPNSYSLVGFGVDAVSPPTFQQFFGGSVEHQPYRIYRLVNNAWVKVDNAQTAQMQSGEAYWVYCRGKSDYQGPLTIRPDVGGQLSLRGSDAVGVLFHNKTSSPLSVRMQNMLGSAQLPVGFALRAVTSTNVIPATYDLPDNYPMQPLEPSERRGFWSSLRPERMASAQQAGFLKISTDLGTECWLPISGKRSSATAGN